MEPTDLLTLRDTCLRQGTLLCFNGPISQSLIEEFGNALRGHMQAQRAEPNSIMDVFSVYIEMTQNIRHYAQEHGYDDQDASATVAIGRGQDGHYEVCAGNLVEQEDGLRLVQAVELLSQLAPDEIRVAYKERRRQPRDPQGSAGLGLLDIARKSRPPLRAALTEQSTGRAFFSLRAAI
jgi:hypothetical protein